jgi:hypothetical protein
MEPPPYKAIDQHALKAPPQAEQSLDRLAAYLTQAANTDREKARAIYRWVTDRIAYDVDNFLAGRRVDDNPRTVLRRRRAVCSGYANLFLALCKEAGVKAARVVGKARGYGYRPGRLKANNGHAWNAVYLEGKWRLLDATWGAGAIGERKFVKRFAEHYFLTPAEQLIFTHLPDEDRWQLLPSPLTVQEFLAQPEVRYELFVMGVEADAIRAASRQEGFRKVVQPFNYPGPPVRLREVPLERYLKAGKAYHFRIEAPDASAVACYHEGQWHQFVAQGPVFEGEVVPGSGRLEVSIMLRGRPGRYHSVLGYEVE